MPRPLPRVTLTHDERIALHRARLAALRGTIAFGLASALCIAALMGSGSQDDPRGVYPLISVLGAAWAWFLRRMPFRLLGASVDLRRNVADVMRGTAGVRQRRGIGLIAPSYWELLLEGHRFALAPTQASQLREGTVIDARIAPKSKVLLSIAQLMPAPAPAYIGTLDADAAAILGLTPREITLLQLIAAGHTDKHIARELGLEPATVRTYNSQLYAKLGARRRTEAVARAHALGLVTNVGD